MSVSLVEYVSTLTTGVRYIKYVCALNTVDGCDGASGATCQCSDHSGWVYKCLWWNLSLL